MCQFILQGHMNRFGEKLKAMRLHNQMTLKQLASILGYSTHSYVSEIESGNKIPTVAFVLQIARLFECTTDQLLRDELEIEPKKINMKGQS
jgi:transcriptional regulator with XRE-family HTH domain